MRAVKTDTCHAATDNAVLESSMPMAKNAVQGNQRCAARRLLRRSWAMARCLMLPVGTVLGKADFYSVGTAKTRLGQPSWSRFVIESTA